VGGAAPVGGIVGEAAEGAGGLEGCFWDIDRSGVNQCIGESPQPPASCVGVNPDGSAPGLFFSASSPPLDLWDFMNVWLEQPADYPTFK
jgi:hypothetical protein